MAELKDLTLTGKLTKVEKKNAEGKATVNYVLVTKDFGDVRLPEAKKKEGEAAPKVDLAQFVDKDVTVTAKGMETERAGQKKVFVREVVSVKENAPAAVEAPKAP
jgi:hypothetical protein